MRRSSFVTGGLLGILASLILASVCAPPVLGKGLDLTSLADQLLTLHNQQRSPRHLPELKINEKLTAAAQQYADYLAATGKFGHDEKGSPKSRMNNAGFHRTAYGENIAKGYPNPVSVMEAWVKSTGHRANILDKHYHQVGFGIARAKNGELVWVVDFGS